MYIDILIFAAIAAALVIRLMGVLGTRHGSERERRNPFAAQDDAATRPPMPKHDGPSIDLDPVQPRTILPPLNLDQLIDMSANDGGRIETGIAEIAAADATFDPNHFMTGARAAFEMIVTAYARGDLNTLKPLLSPKLYNDFAAGVKAREAQGHTSEIIIHRITAARINEAHLGGTMAYITVDFDVEETTVTRDRDGNVVDGNSDRIFSVQDIWTFTKDTRAYDPNWTLIETRSVEKHDV